MYLPPSMRSPKVSQLIPKVDVVPSPPPVRFNLPIPEDNGDDSSSDSDSDYLSFDTNSDDNNEDVDTRTERAAREHERQLVLQAAGLVLTEEKNPPDNLTRHRSSRKRRPAPAAPERSVVVSSSSAKDLPPTPTAEDHAAKLDDAFERYESFKSANSNSNRLSVVSQETVQPPSPRTPSTPTSPNTSRDGESRSSHFLSFLGRRTPAEGDRKPALTISAPIVRVESSEPERQGSPSFGTSWASLVDRTALEGIPSSERRRQESIFELIATEAAYVRDLQLIVEVFYSSMMSLLNEKAFSVVFANIEDLLITNTTFLSLLEDRQKECRLYIDQIGDILKQSMSKMAIYMEYCVNQANAIKFLQSLRETNPELAALLHRLRDEPAARNLDLSSYLLAPMQRVTRYPLLIRQIMNHTDPGPDRRDITDSLDAAESILDHINETIRDQEGRERLKAISQDLWVGQGRLDLTAPTRHMGQRKLLKEGTLLKAKSGRKLRGFLCSDILVLTDESAKSLYRMPMALADIQIREVSGGRDDSVFQVTMAYPRGGGSVALRATSVRDCQVWMQAVDDAGRSCREAEGRAIKRRSKMS